MSRHPLNLALRFALELAALYAFASLQVAANELEISTSERKDRLIQIVIALVPMGAALTALLSMLEAEYWERIGVRPEDLGIIPAERLSMLVVTILLAAGVLGPLLFIGVWQKALCHKLKSRIDTESTTEDRKTNHKVTGVLYHWLDGWSGLIFLGVVVSCVTLTIAFYATPFLVVVVGPAVVAVLIVNALGLEEYFLKQIDLPRYRPVGVFLGFALLAFVIAAVLGYELLVVGPDLRTDGVHNFWSEMFLNIEAFPVEVVDRQDMSSRGGALLLGGARGAHVLYDPCSQESFWIPVPQFELTAIERVECAGTEN